MQDRPGQTRWDHLMRPAQTRLTMTKYQLQYLIKYPHRQTLFNRTEQAKFCYHL